MSAIDFATWCKIGMYMVNRKTLFPRSTNIIQVSNEFPTDKRHTKVPQDYYAQHTSTTRKNQVFEKNNVKCVTRPDLTGVPLKVYPVKLNKVMQDLMCVLTVTQHYHIFTF